MELNNQYQLELQENASAAGAAISECCKYVYQQIKTLISEHFYEYYHELQIQSLYGKRIILLAFEVFNPMTNQYEIYWVSQEILDQTYRTFRVYIQPEVEDEVRMVGVRGQQIIEAATTCAYTINVQFSNVVHSLQAIVQNQCAQ